MQKERLLGISSKDNELIKATRALQNKKGRDEQHRYLIEGLRLCEEAFFSGARLCYALVCEEVFSSRRGSALVEELLVRDLPVYLVPEHLLAACADTVSPQGLVIVLEKQPPQSLEAIKESSFVLVLEGLQDPGNAGTIIRTGKAAGVETIILLNAVEAYNPKLIRAAMGATFPPSFSQRLLIIESSNEEEVRRFLCRIKTRILSATADGEILYQRKLDLASPVAWVLGSEAGGVSSFWRTAADCLVSLPMPGGTESLNVSVTAGILVYETMRQRLYP